jgi:hypothetical protein
MPAETNPQVGWGRHLNRGAEALSLLLAVAIAERLFLETPLSWTAKGVALALLLFAPGARDDGAAPGARRFLKRLPVLSAIAAALGAVFYFMAAPAAPFYLFAPLWIVLCGVCRLAPGAYRLLVVPAYTVVLATVRGDYHLARQASGSIAAAFKAAVSMRIDIILGFAALAGIVMVLGAGFLPHEWQGAPLSVLLDRAHVVFYGYVALAGAGYATALARRARSEAAAAENCRWIVLGVAWVFLMRPFFSVVLQGTPDAAWYGTMMADMLAQVRAGVFPVFSGQSEFQFNGAIYPLRVAPLFHYMGALVDTLTLRTLGAFAVQNLLLCLEALAALVSCYLATAAMLPGKRWAACALSLLFVSCPGVLGIVYNTDLYMSWMTVSLVPVVYYGLVRVIRGDALPGYLTLGGALGLMWWGHTPIALWTTLFSGCAMGIHVLLKWPGRALREHAAMGAALFALIAAYPVISVLAFPPVAGMKPANFQQARPDSVVYFVCQVFPGIFLPLSENGRQLSDFQLGYSLGFMFLVCLVGLRWMKGQEQRILVGIAGCILLLLTPLHGLALALWSLVPGFVRNINGTWAMNRLYVVLAGALVLSGALAINRLLSGTASSKRWVYGVLILMCGWSLAETRRFKFGSAEHPRTEAQSAALLYPENVMVTQYAYLVFPKLPGRFTHGVADPQMENRILSESGSGVLEDNEQGINMQAGPAFSTEFAVDYTSYAGKALIAKDPIVLIPGRRYIAEFQFENPEAASGVLQIAGQTFIREYQLPVYGGAKAFGSGRANSRRLSLWTSAPSPESLTVHFFPDAPRAMAGSLPFAKIRVASYDPALLPVRVSQWIPYQAQVKANGPGWLETPRMYQSAYRARVDGKPAEVRESPDGLAMVAVPKGPSQVTLEFDAPLLLELTFFVSAFSAIGWVLWLARRTFARIN